MGKNIRRNNQNNNVPPPQTNAKYEEIQTRKIISAYGGVGSLLETRSGSIIIAPFNEWEFFTEKKHFNEDFAIEDKRLLARLRRWFTELKALVQVPINTRNEGYFPKERHNTISASFFPKWMYCPNCKRFDHFDNWFRHWQNTAIEKHRFDFNPPKCFKCYGNENQHRFYELEQVRFILISAYGNIVDIPWDRWVFARYQQGKSEGENVTTDNEEAIGNEGSKAWLIDFDKNMLTDIYYEYTMSDKFNDLKGISIVAKDLYFRF